MDPNDTIQSIKIVADEGQDPLGGSPDLFGVARRLDRSMSRALTIGRAQLAHAEQIGAPPPADPGPSSATILMLWMVSFGSMTGSA